MTPCNIACSLPTRLLAAVLLFAAPLAAAAEIPTPGIDRIAREGMRFTDAHSASAVCTPTRYGLLTGRYPWRTRLQAGVAKIREHKMPDGSVKIGDPPLIGEDVLTVPAFLKQHGYDTAMTGKWHLGFWYDLPEGKTISTMPGRCGPGSNRTR